MTTGRINQVMYFILSQATFRRLLVRQDNCKSSEKRNFHIEMWIWTRFPVSANNLFDQPADIPQWWNTLWSAARKLAKILCRIYAEAVWIRHSHHWSDALHILETFRPSCRVIMQHVETKKTQNFTSPPYVAVKKKLHLPPFHEARGRGTYFPKVYYRTRGVRGNATSIDT